MGANNSKDREPDALERLAMSPFFDFLEGGTWQTTAFYFYICVGLITAGLSSAIVARKIESERLLILAKYTWVASILSFLWTCFSAFPRMGKFMTLFITMCVTIPVFLILGTIYIFDDDKKDTKDKAVNAVGGEKDGDTRVAKGHSMEGGSQGEVGAVDGVDEGEVSRVEEPEVVDPPIDGS